ncbi:MAG: NADH:flavin oxidoreductase/NADH oxidase [Hyphomicrobiales bacterium]|nr:NADH:flavin oxidoreductase/NADH oxidase [Hyphomicrobiales bacterium]
MLFRPITFRSVTARNRIALSPMCQYCARDGVPDDWHLAALGQRAVGGGGIVFTEATAVEPRGRISHGCLGLYNDDQQRGFERIARFVAGQGAVPGIQLGHAGRKASVTEPWNGNRPLTADEDPWAAIAPSPVAFDDGYPAPQEMDRATIAQVTDAMAAAVRRAREAGFQVVEVHAAHGYLGHEFLSPLSNRRSDDYGGSLENRTRFVREMAAAARSEWPADLPLFLRLSCTDWVEGGWDLEQSVWLAQQLAAGGEVDLVDCSSGGLHPAQKIALGPGYQAPFAQAVRERAGIATAAVGLITEAAQANAILEAGQADLIMVGRAYLRDPYLPLRFAADLGVDLDWPVQIARGKR